VRDRQRDVDHGQPGAEEKDVVGSQAHFVERTDGPRVADESGRVEECRGEERVRASRTAQGEDDVAGAEALAVVEADRAFALSSVDLRHLVRYALQSSVRRRHSLDKGGLHVLSEPRARDERVGISNALVGAEPSEEVIGIGGYSAQPRRGDVEEMAGIRCPVGHAATGRRVRIDEPDFDSLASLLGSPEKLDRRQGAAGAGSDYRD